MSRFLFSIMFYGNLVRFSNKKFQEYNFELNNNKLLMQKRLAEFFFSFSDTWHICGGERNED